MDQNSPFLEVGRTLRASTSTLVFGCNRLEPDMPRFGMLVRVPVQHDELYGLVYNVVITDDPFAQQLIASPALTEEMVADQRQNRQAPIEVSVLNVGYRREGRLIHRLPPQPPPTLDRIYACSDAECLDFHRSFDFFRIVLNAPSGVPSDQLLAASVRKASECYDDPAARREFLVRAGRELVRLLSRDLIRLEGILNLLRG